MRRDLGSHRISAISVRMPDSRPLFVLNTGMPPDRERWTLCHEAAHLIMHEVPSPDAEREADQFAAELLLPAPEIRPQLHRIDLARAAALKRYWKVSMASLIRRAHDLEVIPANRYKSLCAQMAQRGFNRIEPIDLPREDPSLMDRIVRIHLNDHGYARDQLADILGYNESEFSIECLPASGHLRVIR